MLQNPVTLLNSTDSHYAFYIGDGICVHVSGPNGGTFSSSSSPSSSSKRNGTKCAKYLHVIADGSLCRINNQEMVQYLKKVSLRDKTEEIALATKGLPRDSSGKLILGKRIDALYAVISNNNCEGWATHWRYDCPGWSDQVTNGIIKSTIGTVERCLEVVVARSENAVRMESNMETKVAAAAVIGFYKIVAIAADAVIKTTDVLEHIL